MFRDLMAAYAVTIFMASVVVWVNILFKLTGAS